MRKILILIAIFLPLNLMAFSPDSLKEESSQFRIIGATIINPSIGRSSGHDLHLEISEFVKSGIPIE